MSKTKGPKRTPEEQSRFDKARNAAAALFMAGKTEDEILGAVMSITPTESLDVIIARKLIQLQGSAASRGIEFDLSLKVVRALITRKTCFYTGKKFTDPTLGDHPNMRTIDRVDNTRGYVDDNVVACCKSINSLKGNLTLSQIECMWKGIKKHTNKSVKTLKLIRKVS